MSDIERMMDKLMAPPQPATEVVSLERATLEEILNELEERDAQRPVVIYLRRVLAEPKVELWAMHSIGPCEIYPCLSKEDAEKQAQSLRDTGEKIKAERIAMGESVEMWTDWRAEVIPSPYEPAEHFEIMAEEWQDNYESLYSDFKNLEAAHDAALAREAALQQRLNEADQRIDEINEELQAAIVEAQDWHHKHQTALCELTKVAQPNTCTKDGGQGESVALTAVAVLRDNGDGGLDPRWLLEGGTTELFAGMLLLVADNAPDLCEEDGHAELYRRPPAQAPVVLPERKGLHLHYDSIMPPYSMGWSACIDEFKRLNPTL